MSEEQRREYYVSQRAQLLALKQTEQFQRRQLQAQAQLGRLAARIALSEAFHATTGYYADLANGAARDPKEQHRIAHLWEQAAIRIEPFNPSLASRLGLKERYWREGATWSDSQIADARIQLDAVRQEARFTLIRR